MTLAMNHQPAIRPATYQDVIDAPADKSPRSSPAPSTSIPARACGIPM